MKAAETALAMVCEEFGKPLVPREYAIPVPEEGAVIVQVTAAGVCGSDLDITGGLDPRITLPLIPGHEGVGRVLYTGGEKRDMFGRIVEPGDKIVWHRGVTCGHCYYCAVKRQPSLCLHRNVYGISLSCGEPPHLNGCYAEVLYVRPESEIIKLPEAVDEATLVSATCSGATAAHAIEMAAIEIGDSVLVIGPGPLGLYSAAFALERGARQVIMFGTKRGLERMKLAESFGVKTVNVNEVSAEDRKALVLEMTNGIGPDIVIDAAGNNATVPEAIDIAGRNAKVSVVGVAVPQDATSVRFYEDVALKNLTIQGVWVSDAKHMYQAIQLALSEKYPFEKLVTHRFALREANEALAAAKERVGTKLILEP